MQKKCHWGFDSNCLLTYFRRHGMAPS